jgi:hypothetical protein
MAKYGRRRTVPWYSREGVRIIFERGAVTEFPTLRRTTRKTDGEKCLCYRVDVEVPFYNTTRRIEIIFFPRPSPGTPLVLSDGPDSSPHRYSDFERRLLCIWYPKDPPERRWTPSDGLLHLLGLTQLHLFREYWWRETTEWLGPEANHSRSAA